MYNNWFKIGLYADDIFAILKNSSVRESIRIVRKLELCCGLKMNFEKFQVAKTSYSGSRNRTLCS